MNYETARARFIAARNAYETAQRKADESFTRYFAKLHRGEATNAAQASRLANLANYASADLAGAELTLCMAAERETDDAEAIALSNGRTDLDAIYETRKGTQ